MASSLKKHCFLLRGRVVLLRDPSSKNLPGNLKNQVFPGRSWKKNDPAVGFAPKFCAECNGRELHGSHGDHFREKSQIRPRSKRMSSSRSCSQRNSVQNAPIESSTALTATLFVNFSIYQRINKKNATSGAGPSSSATFPTKCELKNKECTPKVN